MYVAFFIMIVLVIFAKKIEIHRWQIKEMSSEKPLYTVSDGDYTFFLN